MLQTIKRTYIQYGTRIYCQDAILYFQLEHKIHQENILDGLAYTIGVPTVSKHQRRMFNLPQNPGMVVVPSNHRLLCFQLSRIVCGDCSRTILGIQLILRLSFHACTWDKPMEAETQEDNFAIQTYLKPKPHVFGCRIGIPPHCILNLSTYQKK